MVRLINTSTGEEIFAGQSYVLFRILAIDYVEQRVLVKHLRDNNIREFNSWRYRFRND